MRPSEVYRGQTREEVLERIAEWNYKVVAFREPDNFEYYWGTVGRPCRGATVDGGKRLILRERDSE